MPELPGSVADAFAERIRVHEERWLAPLAVRSYAGGGREHAEPECRLRTPFQRDRDRIVHCKAFRRLKHKTQVLIAPEGDHLRTRMTHTIEAAGIARTVARALALNEDLTEAIALGHDLGHPPFGHNGEDALDQVLSERFDRRFRHNEHSLRVVEQLERDGRGLNLTHEVRDGILNHTGDGVPGTLEGQIVRLVDRVAYLNHDVDDAVSVGVLDPAALPVHVVETLGATGSSRIDTLVHDIVESSWGADTISQSPRIGQTMLDLRAFMFEHVYLGPFGKAERETAIATVRRIFDHYLDHPDELPSGRPGDLVERVTDYVAGMTDRFALRFAAGG